MVNPAMIPEPRLPTLRRALAVAVALLALAGPAASAGGRVDWFSLVTATGAPVGYARVEYREDGQGSERIEYQETTLREQDARSTLLSERTVTRQDPEGRTLSIVSESSVGPNRTRTEGRMVPGAVVVTRESRGGRSTTAVPVGPRVRFDGGDGLMAEWDPSKTSTLEFESFNLSIPGVERIVLTALGDGRPDAEGRITVLRATYDRTELRGVSRLTLDADHNVLSLVQPVYGSSLTLLPTDEATAMQPRGPFRMMTTLMMKSPFRIPSGATEGHIRYRFGFRDGMSFDLPQTGEQRVTRNGEFAVVDICETCGPGLPTDAVFLADARRPTTWLQSDDRRIKAVVGPVASNGMSDRRKMEVLTRMARRYLGEIDFAGHYSASEILDRRRGDCTEAAVLLAAFGRAAGIPTKTVSGFVYSRERYHGVSNVFMPHSWTLAYVDGRWRSFDSALADFDTTHIAVTVGDGDMRSMAASGQLASLLTWEAMNEVRTRPGT